MNGTCFKKKILVSCMPTLLYLHCYTYPAIPTLLYLPCYIYPAIPTLLYLLTHKGILPVFPLVYLTNAL